METRREVGSYLEEFRDMGRAISSKMESDWFAYYDETFSQVKKGLVDPIYADMDAYLTHTKASSRLRLFPIERPIFKNVSGAIEPRDKFEELIKGIMLLQDAGTGKHGRLFKSSRDKVISVVKGYEHIARFTNLQRTMNFFAIYIAVKELLPTVAETDGGTGFDDPKAYFTKVPFLNLIANLSHILETHPQFQANRFWFFTGDNKLTRFHLRPVLNKLVAAVEGAGSLIPGLLIKWEAYNDDSTVLARYFKGTCQEISKNYSYEHIAKVLGRTQYIELRESIKALHRENQALESELEELTKNVVEIRSTPNPDLKMAGRRDRRMAILRVQIRKNLSSIGTDNQKLLSMREEIVELADDCIKTNSVAKRFIRAHVDVMKTTDRRCGELEVWKRFLSEYADKEVIIKALQECYFYFVEAKLSIKYFRGPELHQLFTAETKAYLEDILEKLCPVEAHGCEEFLHSSAEALAPEFIAHSVGSVGSNTSTLSASSARSVPSADSSDSDPESPVATIKTHSAPPKSASATPMFVPPKNAILYAKTSHASGEIPMPKPSAPPAEVCARGREARFISNARPNAGAGLPSIHYPRQ